MKIRRRSIYYCDICGKEIVPSNWDIDGPFHFRYFVKTKYRKSKRMDVCDNCRYEFVMWVKNNKK